MDLILFNGNIVTMDSKTPNAEAVAINNGEIFKVGCVEDILSYQDGNTVLFDLKGKTVLPGFNDSHMHLFNYGLSLQTVNLENVNSIDNMIITVKNFIDNNKITTKQWVRGLKWNHHFFIDKRLPNRYDLDKISKEIPIVLSRVCGHLIVTNSKALELIGITKETSQLKGGHFDVDDNGEPLGTFHENAIRLILDYLPIPNIKEIKETLKLASENLLQYGITTVQTDDFSVFPNSSEKVITAYQELNDEGNLPIRVNQQVYLPNLTKLTEFISKDYITYYNDNFFKIGPLKLLADGSLGARSAYLKEPYSDDPSTNGIAVYSQEELDELVITAHNADMQVAIHAIGDKTMEMICNSIEKAQTLKPRKDARHGIIHCQITNINLFYRFKELNIIALIQPLFVSTDLHFAEQKIGSTRAQTSYNWKSFIDNDVKIACGSDCPVEPPNVLYGIYSAVTRKDLSGYPEKGWYPEQKITVEQAVYGYTLGAAYASFEENIKGSLTEGKLADLTVISDNIFEIDPNDIKDVKVEMTFVNGKLKYFI